MKKIADEAKKVEGANILNQPVKADIVFKFAAVPLPEVIEVCTLPIWTGRKGAMNCFDEFGERTEAIVANEDLDSCYFSMNTALMKEGPQPTHTLPKGFYCNEFLQLNPLDIQELLFFQREYGRITGARKRKPYDFETDPHSYLRPEPDGDVFAGTREMQYEDQLAGIKASQALYDTVPDEEYVREDLLDRMGAVSFRESIAAVLDAQNVIKSLLRVHRNDLGPMTVLEADRAKKAAEYVSIILGKTVPAIQLVVEGADYPHFYNLIDGVFIQLARGLLGNDAYRTCANTECGRTFTPREMDRRLDTKYCSAKCQERAKRLRYIDRHSKRPATKQ